MLRRLNGPVGNGPRRVPVRGLFVERRSGRDFQRLTSLGGECVQHGLRDFGRIGIGGGLQAQRSEHLVLQQRGHVLAGGLLQRQAQQDVIGVRVVPVCSRIVQQWPRRDLGKNVLGCPLLERICVKLAAELRVADHVVGVAGRHLRQLPQGDALRVRKVGQPLRQFVVETEFLFVDELEQQRRHVGDCHRPIAEVHVGGGGHARHRVADGLREDFLAVHRDSHDHRPQVRLRHAVADHPHHRVGLGLVGGARRRRGVRRAATGDDQEGENYARNAPRNRHDPST